MIERTAESKGMESHMTNNAQKTESENVRTMRKPYQTPHLEKLGDLRSLTLGGSRGCGESGSCVRKVKHGLLPGYGQPTPGKIPLPGTIPPPGDTDTLLLP